MSGFRPQSPFGNGTAMSRDARDTLFLLGVIGWTLLPLFSHVPGWCSAYAIAALAWRAWLAWRHASLPPRWVLLGALAIAAVGTAWSHQTLLGKDAGVSLLVLLAALKTLELRARRDAVVVFFLGFVLVLANFLHSQSLGTALAMLGSVAGLLAALALAHMPSGRPGLAQALGLAARHALVGMPLVLLLFLFFPRLPPLWGQPASNLGHTGLSDDLELGQVAELVSDDSLAMRVDFLGRPPPAGEALYFRGPVLRLYDGRRWRADDGGVGAPPAPGLPPTPGSGRIQLTLDQPVDYEVTFEPLRVASLPLLEFTALQPQLESTAMWLALRDDLHWQPQRPIQERLKLRGLAHLRMSYDLSTGVIPEGLVKPADLALPANVHPLTQAWSTALRRPGGPLYGVPGERLAAQASDLLLQHIRNAGFQYALAPGEGRAGDRDDAVDDFWLAHRTGFCEHYAAAYVVVMRSLGVPARIVTGYQGGTLNPLNGLLEVRQSDAHAWAEIWLPERGWTRVDPTAAVAPDRVRQGLRLRVPPGLMSGALTQVSPEVLERLRQIWGAVDHRWNDWVLQYGRQRQRDLLEDLGWEQPDLLTAGRTLLLALAALGLAGAAWAAWDGWRSQRRDPWLRLLTRTQATLLRRGLTEALELPPRSLAERVLQRWGAAAPQAATEVADALRRLDAWRYAAAPSAADSSRGSTGVATLGQLRQRLQKGLRQLPALH